MIILWLMCAIGLSGAFILDDGLQTRSVLMILIGSLFLGLFWVYHIVIRIVKAGEK